MNEHGTLVTLLNNYQVAGPAAERRLSRGVLVRALASSRDLGHVREQLEELDATRFMGFTLLALHPLDGAAAFGWDGERLDEVAAEALELPMLVSSSHREVQRVRSLRTELLQQRAGEAGGIGPDLLADFHRSHVPEPSVYSVCMHREGVQTVSSTRVRVDAERVAMSYSAGPPCRTPFGEPLELPRAR